MRLKQSKNNKMTKKTTNNEVAIIPNDSPAESLISQAIEKGASVETMERLLVMRTQLKKEWAKEQFDKAMSEFQGECPVIKKTKAGGQTKSGQVAYYYAPLDSIVSQTKELIKEKGFSYAIQTQTLDGKVKVTCVIKHQNGHSESSDIEVPLGNQTGVMSASQVVASALTFAKRYAFCNSFGILTGDDDDDSNLTKEKTPDDRLTIILEKISKDTRADSMIEFDLKVQSSDKYTSDQKKTIHDAITSRVDNLQK